MWRVVLRPALLFLLPFLLYAVWLLLRRTTPFARDRWGRGVVSTLTLLGLGFLIIFSQTAILPFVYTLF